MARRLSSCFDCMFLQFALFCLSRNLLLCDQVSFGSLVITLIALFRAARLRQAEALFQDTDPSSSASKLLKHKKNHERISRTVNEIYAGVAVAAAECMPLGILQSIHLLFWFIGSCDIGCFLQSYCLSALVPMAASWPRCR